MADLPPPPNSPPPPPGHAPNTAAPPQPGSQPAPGAPPASGVRAPGQPAGEIRPKARWYWIGGGVIVIGVIGAIAYAIVGFVGIADTVGDFERVRPGSGTVTIESPGEYVVYFEDASPNGRVAMTAPSGEPVLLSTYSNELSYDFDGRNGSAVATFDATETGEYTIETDTAVAIGPSVAGELIRAILVPFAIAGIAFVLGVIILIVTGVQRSGSKRRLAQAAWHP